MHIASAPVDNQLRFDLNHITSTEFEAITSFHKYNTTHYTRELYWRLSCLARKYTIYAKYNVLRLHSFSADITSSS